jgi:predicted GNAT family acetyltransferase
MATTTPGYVIRDNVDKQRFEADLGDGSLAIADYTLHPGKIIFTHTFVPPAYEGQGVGSALIRHALAAARERGLKVVPICPFFAAYIKRHREEQDLLDPGSREKLGL